MKHAILALSLVAVLGLAACSNNGGTWTPMSGGRTAGEGTVEQTKVEHKADRAVSHSLHK
ncbi:MAG: hypothetical protein PW788_11045 [Micavibrio sp.]|nr:hypothetical protein [Micavibrio sp.]